MNDKITVVVPYYNEMETIEYTLELIGQQTLLAQTAIFVNSSSKDNTFDVIDAWIKKNQHRFSTQFLNVFENTDNPASSKNIGVSRAETEWVAFMDCGHNFDKTWLESQVKYAKKTNLDVVSGVVYCIGENWVDRCAIAQTYGYKRSRACIPTTLVKKSVFEKTGLFLEKRRAGYDVAWPLKLRKFGIERGINEDVKIAYKGVNFSSNLKNLFIKSVVYAKPTVGIEGYYIPYYYITALLLTLAAAVISFKLAIIIGTVYFFARTFIIPLLKSNNTLLYIEHPFESLLGLGIVGLVIDLGKMVGIIGGIKYYLFN